ncbi:MAG: hypothetical protein AAGL68_02470 [Pseudomonadota bacterium]
MKFSLTLALLAASSALTACKPPPTDADMARDMPEDTPRGPSEPIDSPDVEGAIWAASATPWRIVYGKPGEAPLVALACLDEGPETTLRVTRFAPADEGAGAVLAFVGNGHIGRMKVDATEVNGASVWQGDDPAADTDWEPLTGPRELTLTVPGAGMVTLNPSSLPVDLVAGCRGGKLAPGPELAPEEGPIDEPEPAEEAYRG